MKKTQRSLYMDEDLWRLVRTRSVLMGISASDFINQAVGHYLAESEAPAEQGPLARRESSGTVEIKEP